MFKESTKANQALSICFERGQEALGLFALDQTAEALGLLKKRKMAFCNFRYYATEEDVSELLMRSVLEQDQSLEKALAQAMEELKAERSGLVKSKVHIRKFQSSSQNPSGFQRSI